jgi:hypothetical protein
VGTSDGVLCIPVVCTALVADVIVDPLCPPHDLWLGPPTMVPMMQLSHCVFWMRSSSWIIQRVLATL